MKNEIIKVKHVKPFQEELSKSSLRVIADVYVWIAVTEMCFEKKTKEPVVGTFRDICTEALHCWYKKKSLCRISLTNFWKKKKIWRQDSGWPLEIKVYLEKFIPSQEVQEFHVILGRYLSCYVGQPG